MPREKEDYRIILEGIMERFPGVEVISIPQAAKMIGMKPERYRADPTWPKFSKGKQQAVNIRALARRMAMTD